LPIINGEKVLVIQNQKLVQMHPISLRDSIYCSELMEQIKEIEMLS
jgi:hypothetical protein